MLFRITFFLLGTVLFTKNNICAAQIELSDTTGIYRIDEQIEVLIDSTGRLTFDDVTDLTFRKSNRYLTFGYLKKPIWLKINAKSLQPNTRWYLEIPAPFLEYVDFYQRTKAGWQHSRSGYYRAQSERVFPHTNHALPLTFDSAGTTEVYIQITGLSPKTFPVYVMNKEVFHQKTRTDDLWYGVFFGILLVMFFYNFFIYLSLKQLNYVLYMGTIVCTFLIFASASGYGGRFLWPENPHVNFYTGRLSLGVLTCVLAIFTIRFLEVRKYTKGMYYALITLVPLAVLAIVLVAIKEMPSAGNNLISISTIMFITTGIVCRVKGNAIASYYIAAWTIYLFGGLLLTLRNSGVFDFNFWTTHFVEIGAAMETSIIAFALGDRYRRYKREKEEIQLQALKIQQSANELLEKRVKERTEDLIRANTELHANLATISKQAEIIEAKNAELDGFFYRISHDLKGPISSLLGLSHLAKLEIHDAKALDYINRQHEQVDRLNQIIRGLINLTRLNNTSLTREKIDFVNLIDTCINSLQSLSKFPKIRFVKDVAAGIEYEAEWVMLNAIMQNLIENSIKYSRDTHPFVRITIHQQDDYIILEVEDNGLGIAQEHQTKIFEMFYRATDLGTGSGLGLYILKRSVERLKGKIKMASKEGEGSTFSIQLPLVH
ncbi:MAG: sensor histidine kinase [Cyclobacteriaceae bacterium]|nr:sensor histidine kinase [Cyclobacteriaceae bacterium]